MTIFLDTAPNWARGVEVEVVFSTDIWASQDGTELRRAQRSNPRRTLQFTPAEGGDAARDLWVSLSGGQDEAVVAPDYTRFVSASSPVAAGASTIPVDSVPDWVVADARIVLAHDDGLQELTVAGVGASSITVYEASGGATQIGAKLYPGFTGILSETLDVSWHTSAVVVGAVSVQELPGLNTPHTPALWPDSYEGLPLFERKPDWSDRPKVKVVATREQADFGKGRIAVYDPRGFSGKVLQFGHTGSSRAESEALVDFFLSMRGRRGEFWCPSWTDDLRMAEPLALGGTALVVAGTGTARHLNDPAHRHVAIQMRDGARHHRAVSNFSESAGNSQLTLDAALPAAVNPEDVESIAWLYRSRFASDRASFTWLTDEIVDVTLNIQTLREAS